MKKEKNIKSSDGVEFKLTVFEDVVKLNKGQVELIEEEIGKIKSSEVENNGVPVRAVTEKQSEKILNLISEILKDFSTLEEIVESEIIDHTWHAEHDRISASEICIDRNWNYEKIDYEIAECIKRSYRVEQIRVRFDPHTKESWPTFAFTILGLKGGEGIHNAEIGKIVIYFDEDPLEEGKTIMVITILDSGY